MHIAWHSRNGAGPDGFSDPRWGRGYNWTQPELYCDLSRMLELARVDMIVFSDGIESAETTNDIDGPGTGQPVARLDTTPLIAMIATATSDIGLVPTLPSSFYKPFMVARLVATLDHLTEGRIAWGVKPLIGDKAAEMFSARQLPTAAERMAMADEFIVACRKLWDTWKEGAVVGDWSTAQFADPSKVGQANHNGTYYKTRGPLNVVRGPQGQPLMVVAAGNAQEMGFAARNADIVILTSPTLAEMQSKTVTLRTTAAAAGRSGDDLIVLHSINPYVAASKEGAEIFEKMSDASYGPAIAGSYRITGSPNQVCDEIEHLHRESGGDGFALDAMWLPSYVSDVTSRILPLLQRRGSMPHVYSGKTLRENLARSA